MTLIQASPRRAGAFFPQAAKDPRSYDWSWFFNGGAGPGGGSDDLWDAGGAGGAGVSRAFSYRDFYSARYESGVTDDGLRSMRVTGSGAGSSVNIKAALPSGFDPTGKWAVFAFRHNTQASFDSVSRIDLQFNNTLAPLKIWEKNQQQDWGHWIVVAGQPNRLEGASVDLVGAPSNLTSLKVVANCATPADVDLQYGFLGFCDPPASQGALAIRVDDSRLGNYDLLAIADSYGLACNIAFIDTDLNGTSNFSTKMMRAIAQMKSGHFFCNHLGHGIGGPPEWQGASSAKIRGIIDRVARKMEDLGLGEGARTVIVPGGWTRLGDTADLLDTGVAQALWYAGAGEPFTSTSGHFEIRPWPLLDRRRWPAHYLCTDVAEAQGVIDLAESNKGLASIYIHSGDMTNGDWATVCAYARARIDAGGIAPTLTVPDLMSGSAAGV